MIEEATVEETLELLDLAIAIRESVKVTVDGFQISDVATHVKTVAAGVAGITGIDKVPLELANLDEEEASLIREKVEILLGFELEDSWISVGQAIIKAVLKLLGK